MGQAALQTGFASDLTGRSVAWGWGDWDCHLTRKEVARLERDKARKREPELALELSAQGSDGTVAG